MQDTSWRELKKYRTAYSCVRTAGGGRYVYEQSKRPMHFLKNKAYVPFDLTPKEVKGVFHLTAAPFDVRVSEGGFFFQSQDKIAEVQLVGADFSKHEIVDNIHTWLDVFKNTDYLIVPSSNGCQTLLYVKDADAPLKWKWSIPVGLNLIPAISGRDAEGKIIEFVEKRTDDTIELELTGRGFRKRGIRQARGIAYSDLVFPLTIDPVVNENVAAGADDVNSVWGNNGTVYSYLAAADAYLRAGRTGTNRFYAGVRFQTVAVPQGVTLNSATLTVRAATKLGTPNINIFGNNVNSASAFSGGNRIKNMSKTVASANLNNPAWAAGDVAITVTSIVQEILNRIGWVSNNNIAFGFFNNAGANSDITFASFDNPTLTEPRLAIDYITPPGFGPPPFSPMSGMSTLLRR